MTAFVRSFVGVNLHRSWPYEMNMLYHAILAPLSDYHRTNNCERSSVMRLFCYVVDYYISVPDSVDFRRMSMLTLVCRA